MPQEIQLNAGQHEEPGVVLSVKSHDTRYLINLLRGVSFANRANVIITPAGLKINVEEARSILGTAYIFSDVFDEYIYTPPVTAPPPTPTPTASQADPPISEIEICINPLIEALSIFGSGSGAKRKPRYALDGDGDGDAEAANGQARIEGFLGPDGRKGAGMRMSYRGRGYPLELVIAEDAKGPTATCEITTYDAEAQVDLALDHTEVVLRVIIKSHLLHEALSEFDTSYDTLTLIAHPPEVGRLGANGRPLRTASAKPIFRMRAAGPFGSTELDYPNDREIITDFECERPVSFSYRFQHMVRATRALQHSTSTALRIDSNGVLSMQVLIPPPRANAQDGYVDFLCLPIDDQV